MGRVTVTGRNALITGGAQGMGLLWAKHLVKDGARVILWDVNETRLEEAKAEILRLGGHVFVQPVDVSDRHAVYAAARIAEQHMGPIDILINNAGIVAAGRFLEMPDEKLAATIDVDVKALLWTIKAVLPGMIQRSAGHIINVSSASGFIGVPYMPAYAASKWAVIGLTESLRLEMAQEGHTGIRFTLFCPSYVDTGMFAGVKPPLLTPIMTPEIAVARAYKAFCRGDYFILEPFIVKFTPALKALLPRAVFDRISDILGVTKSARDVRGHT
jgi:all-trans-retinol dehydrogenase (NAD+)